MSIFNRDTNALLMLELESAKELLRHQCQWYNDLWSGKEKIAENKINELLNKCKEIEKSFKDYKTSIQNAFNLQLKQPNNTYVYERRLTVREIIETISTGRPLDWRLCDICNTWFPNMDIHTLSKPILNEKMEDIGLYAIRYCRNEECKNKAGKLLRDYQNEENKLSTKGI